MVLETVRFEGDGNGWKRYNHYQAPLPTPLPVATYLGVKAHLLENSHGVPTFTPAYFRKLGLSEEDYPFMVEAGERAEREYKERMGIELIGDYAIGGFPHQIGIVLSKLSANLRFLRGRNIILPEPVRYTDWVYGWGRKKKNGKIKIEKIFNRPNTQEEFDTLFKHYETPDSQLYSVHGQAVYYPKSQKVHAGVTVVELGGFNRNPYTIQHARAAYRNNIGKRAGGLHVPTILVDEMVQPQFDELYVFRGEVPMPIDANDVDMYLGAPHVLSPILLHDSHKIPLLRDHNPPYKLFMRDYDIAKIERGCMDLEWLIYPEEF